MLLISSGASPELVNVTIWGGYGPCGLLAPKVTLRGASLADGAAADTPMGIPTATRNAATAATIGIFGFTTRHLNRGPPPIRVASLSGFPSGYLPPPLRGGSGWGFS